jgi:hypothetical protein
MFVRLLVATCLLGLLAPSGQVEAAASVCLNGSCHQTLTKSKYLHGPVAAELAGAKACVMCHLPAGPACTATAKGVFKLKGKEICQACHTKGNGSQHSQSEIESKCLKCHAPHGSETSRQFLRGDKAALLKKK